MAEETKKVVEMERIYADYEDKFVHATIVYLGEDDVLYKDEELTIGVTKEELKELFLKGLVIKSGYRYERAIILLTDIVSGADYYRIMNPNVNSVLGYSCEYLEVETPEYEGE